MKSPSAQSSQGPRGPRLGGGGTKVRYRVNGAPTRAFHATVRLEDQRARVILSPCTVLSVAAPRSHAPPQARLRAPQFAGPRWLALAGRFRSRCAGGRGCWFSIRQTFAFQKKSPSRGARAFGNGPRLGGWGAKVRFTAAFSMPKSFRLAISGQSFVSAGPTTGISRRCDRS
jgi:hypothetical protein